MSGRNKKSEVALKGEIIASHYLENKGYEILHKNWRYSRLGEIDIIARKEDAIVFVEVKTRSSLSCGDPLESINVSKQKKIARLAEAYISENAIPDTYSFRLDAISILLKVPPEINHLKDAYSTNYTN
jgi:putative endonuclease